MLIGQMTEPGQHLKSQQKGKCNLTDFRKQLGNFGMNRILCFELFYSKCGPRARTATSPGSFKKLFIYLCIWLHQFLVMASRSFSTYGIWAKWLQCAVLAAPMAYGILVPRSGTEPTYPVLQDAFLTTGPPGKSQPRNFLEMQNPRPHP